MEEEASGTHEVIMVVKSHECRCVTSDILDSMGDIHVMMGDILASMGDTVTSMGDGMAHELELEPEVELELRT